jgi:hypothetical protein
MSNVPINAILALVQYLETDERKHFEARWSAGEDVSRHIYHSIKLVSDWLDTLPGVQSAADREREFMAPLLDAFAKAGALGILKSRPQDDSVSRKGAFALCAR